MKYHLITLGCQMNLSDSERVSSVLESMGYERTDNEEEASLLGMLACSVRQKPIDKVYQQNCPMEQMEKQTQCGHLCLRMYFACR